VHFVDDTQNLDVVIARGSGIAAMIVKGGICTTMFVLSMMLVLSLG
jgi:hypothetical protein